MAKVPITYLMADSKVNGKKMFKTTLEKNFGMTAQAMKEITRMVSKMAKDVFNGKKMSTMKESSLRTE